jgi:hypothetical protein
MRTIRLADQDIIRKVTAEHRLQLIPGFGKFMRPHPAGPEAAVEHRLHGFQLSSAALQGIKIPSSRRLCIKGLITSIVVRDNLASAASLFVLTLLGKFAQGRFI